MPFITADGRYVERPPPPPCWKLPFLFLLFVAQLLFDFFRALLPKGRQNPSVIKSGFRSAGGGGGGGGAPPPSEPRNIKGFDNSFGSSTNNCAPGGG